jgi:hypothetical protein
MIDHGGGHNYVVVFFRVQGGRRQDFVYHTVDAPCELVDLTTQPATEKLYDFVRPRAIESTGPWRARWPAGPGLTAVAWNLSQPGERAFVADGWGQRDWKNSDIGATIPYIVRRCEGDGVKTFISVFEGHESGGPFVRGVKRLDASGVLVIETALGSDYVMSMPDTSTLAVRAPGEKRITGHFVVAAVQDSKLAWTFVEKGKGTPPPATPAGTGAKR